MGKRASKKSHTIPTKRIIILLAARIQSGETTAEQELDAGEDAWIYNTLHENLKGFNKKMGPKKRSDLKEIVKKICTPGEKFHGYLSEVLDKMTNGKTEQQLLEEFDEANNLPEAPAGANVDHAAPPSSKEDKEEEEETNPLGRTAPVRCPKYTPMPAQSAEPFVMFGGRTSSNEGHQTYISSDKIFAWLNMLVHVILTKDYHLKDVLLQEITSPAASKLFEELRRSRGVITGRTYNLEAKYVNELRKTPEGKERTAEEVDAQLCVDYPSSVILRSLYCDDGCDTYIQTNEKLELNTKHWKKLQEINADGRDYETHFCPECGQNVQAKDSYQLPPKAISINLPQFKDDGKTLFHDGAYGLFEEQFPNKANLRGKEYHRRYAIISTKDLRGEHRLVIFDPPNGDVPEVITSKKPRCVSTKMTEWEKPISETFLYAVKVVYKKAPGNSRMSDLKSFQQQGGKAAGGANAAGPSRPRRK